mmetsp:Transcript_39215/g.101456  ORF Transcript_39215/g.101456 Transcript_39215/m.101456 type:complete len:396 (+) Transcript_39215:1733-2920(+)
MLCLQGDGGDVDARLLAVRHPAILTGQLQEAHAVGACLHIYRLDDLSRPHLVAVAHGMRVKVRQHEHRLRARRLRLAARRRARRQAGEVPGPDLDGPRAVGHGGERGVEQRCSYRGSRGDRGGPRGRRHRRRPGLGRRGIQRLAVPSEDHRRRLLCRRGGPRVRLGRLRCRRRCRRRRRGLSGRGHHRASLQHLVLHAVDGEVLRQRLRTLVLQQAAAVRGPVDRALAEPHRNSVALVLALLHREHGRVRLANQVHVLRVTGEDGRRLGRPHGKEVLVDGVVAAVPEDDRIAIGGQPLVDVEALRRVCVPLDLALPTNGHHEQLLIVAGCAIVEHDRLLVVGDLQALLRVGLPDDLPLGARHEAEALVRLPGEAIPDLDGVAVVRRSVRDVQALV